MDPHLGMRFMVIYLNDGPSIVSSLLEFSESVVKLICSTQMRDMAIIILMIRIPSSHPTTSFTVKELLSHKARNQENNH
jgi:hypothetical protein